MDPKVRGGVGSGQHKPPRSADIPGDRDQHSDREGEYKRPLQKLWMVSRSPETLPERCVPTNSDFL